MAQVRGGNSKAPDGQQLNMFDRQCLFLISQHGGQPSLVVMAFVPSLKVLAWVHRTCCWQRMRSPYLVPSIVNLAALQNIMF
jgi:hypothetical protein